MASSTDVPNAVPLNLERELVCFICTEIVHQPLSLIDCLHFFCGACLKEWFSHQHRKATLSSSASSSSYPNPYTCPTCRGAVKGVKHNAMVNTLLDMFLTANPGRNRSEEERQEMERIYKPGDNILPKVESRRRERRGRREEDAAEARERRMIEDARERSLREVRGNTSTSQSTLQPPTASRQSQSSRSRDREERRERRRDRERREHGQQAEAAETAEAVEAVEAASVQEGYMGTDQHRRESVLVSAPATSPRNPEAVEARQRQQTVVHQSSLISLIGSSEGSTENSNDSDTNRIMQEILAEGLGLLDGVDVDALTETEQDALAERIAEAYRQRRRERNERNNPGSENPLNVPPAIDDQASNVLQVEDSRHHQRVESGNSRHRRADTVPGPTRDELADVRPRSARTHPVDSSNSLPPPSSVVLTHRRRASSQDQRDDGSRNRSRQSSPTPRSTNSRSQSTADVANRPQPQDQATASRATGTNESRRPPTERRDSPRGSEARSQGRIDATRSNGASNTSVDSPGSAVPQSNLSPRQRPVETVSSDTRPLRSNVQSVPFSTAQARRRTSGLYEEPLISCFRCHRADIQYEVYRHCATCDLALCLRCYRTGRGCKHWYGFGHAAMAQFESLQPASFEQMELPHTLSIGRQYKRPEEFTVIRSKLAKDGTTTIPLQTTSNPVTRFQEGRFCDRCNNFADSCFWSCDYCNYGEWGFCRDCVNTHHCCTHPLLPSAHKSYAPVSPTARHATDNINPTSSELLTANLRPSPTPSQPSSATSATSATAGPFPDYISLVITTHCDICSQPIPPSSYRFHCPFHPSPSPTNPDARGDYDICTPCYHNLVKINRIKRDDGPAGWRKCPSGHRMIITTFHADNEGSHRRVVVNDLVGGWKTPEEALNDWNAELEARREQGNSDNPSKPSSPDGGTARRLMRARTGSYPADPLSPTGASPFNSSSRFPPDGGTGLRGVAWWSYFPDDADKGPNDLTFPSGAEVREVRINDEYPDWCGGVYAGDRGLLPASYLRI